MPSQFHYLLAFWLSDCAAAAITGASIDRCQTGCTRYRKNEALLEYCLWSCCDHDSKNYCEELVGKKEKP